MLNLGFKVGWIAWVRGFVFCGLRGLVVNIGLWCGLFGVCRVKVVVLLAIDCGL